MGADDFHVSVGPGHPKTNPCEKEDQVMFLVLMKFEEEGLWPDEETVLGKFANYYDALACIRERTLSEQALCRIVEVRRTWGPRIEFEKEKQWDS